MNATTRLTIGGLLVVLTAGASAQAPVNAYPTKPVRIITGAAGSTVHDVATRHLGQRLSERWGQPIVVENQPAAALTIGTGIAARATPDGYTLLMSDRSALSVAPSLYKQLQYDPVKDLSPITQVAKLPSALVAHPSVPATTLREFLDYAKQQPDSINFASAGVGTAGHIANELFKSVTGINLVNIHYKGGGASVLALMGGEVKAGVALMGNVLPHVRSGKLKVYVVTGKTRFAGAPEIPSAVDAGLPGLDTEFWIGMLAPARTPEALIARLHREMTEIIRTPDYQAALLKQGAEASAGTPDQFAGLIKSETIKWAKVIKDAGIKSE